MKTLIFFCIASVILVLSIVTINIAPIINGLVGSTIYHADGSVVSHGWWVDTCKSYNDEYKYTKKYNNDFQKQEDKEKYLKLIKEGENKCKRNKAMMGLEYVAFNINIIFGLTCTLLGLLFYLKLGENNGKIIGLIGVGCGGIGFVLTLVYIIYSGIIFTKDVVNKNFFSYNIYSDAQIKIDSDGAFLKWDESKKGYVCIFYDENNEDSVYLKYSDFGNINLNYNKDNYYNYETKNYKKYFVNVNGQTNAPSGCVFPSSTLNVNNFWNKCKKLDEKTENISESNGKYKIRDDSNNVKGECDKLLAFSFTDNNLMKSLYDHWVTTIILGCFIIASNIGLAIFGFLLYKETNEKLI